MADYYVTDLPLWMNRLIPCWFSFWQCLLLAGESGAVQTWSIQLCHRSINSPKYLLLQSCEHLQWKHKHLTVFEYSTQIFIEIEFSNSQVVYRTLILWAHFSLILKASLYLLRSRICKSNCFCFFTQWLSLSVCYYFVVVEFVFFSLLFS